MTRLGASSQLINPFSQKPTKQPARKAVGKPLNNNQTSKAYYYVINHPNGNILRITRMRLLLFNKEQERILHANYHKNNLFRVEKRVFFNRSRKKLPRFASLKNKEFGLVAFRVSQSNNNTFATGSLCVIDSKDDKKDKRKKVKRVFNRVKVYKPRKQKIPEKVHCKASAGTRGYHGPKKPTQQSRLEVIEAIARHLYELGFVYTRIIFKHKVYLWIRIRRGFRQIFTAVNYTCVTTISMEYRRPHGYVRLKKKKRL